MAISAVFHPVKATRTKIPVGEALAAAEKFNESWAAGIVTLMQQYPAEPNKGVARQRVTRIGRSGRFRDRGTRSAPTKFQRTQKYLRTGKYGRAWKITRVPGADVRHRVTNNVRDKRGRAYADYVGGPNQAGNNRHWKRLADVVAASEPIYVAKLQQGLKRYMALV